MSSIEPGVRRLSTAVNVHLVPGHGSVQWTGRDRPVVASLTVRNSAGSPAHLIDVYSPDYEDVWLSEVVPDPDGRAHRRQPRSDLASLVVPPRAEVVLGPAAVCIMAAGPRRNLEAEDLVRFALRFSPETTLVASLPLVLVVRDGS
ncbi:copper chaperone PCu(A)C [Amycolatopsis sp. NPDC059090]|uniref:copper chaperone PCu(A)C n=1 Tax=Amycolatopsis sp. NPDC059090 TaxID=3346723 RepID=UPI00366DB39B